MLGINVLRTSRGVFKWIDGSVVSIDSRLDTVVVGHMRLSKVMLCAQQSSRVGPVRQT